MTNFLSETIILISTVHNEELINMTHISKLEQDSTVDKGGNDQRQWLTCRQILLEMLRGLYSHIEPEHSDPNGQMLKGSEKYNISQNQTNVTVQFRDIAVWISAPNVLSLSFPFIRHS
jgi:hypothetical protein